jgi:D-serine deaminase-like pyridoxal phosphate-dependent protein
MPHPRVKFLDLGVPEVINHSEEHLVLSSPEFSKLSIGDMVYALPIHVCPTIALHDQVYVVKDQILKDVWRVIARNRKYE